MPLFKYKSFEEARKAQWNFSPDDSWYVKLSELYDMAFKLAPPVCRPGIRYYKTIEEANADR